MAYFTDGKRHKDYWKNSIHGDAFGDAPTKKQEGTGMGVASGLAGIAGLLLAIPTGGASIPIATAAATGLDALRNSRKEDQPMPSTMTPAPKTKRPSFQTPQLPQTNLIQDLATAGDSGGVPFTPVSTLHTKQQVPFGYMGSEDNYTPMMGLNVPQKKWWEV